MDQRRLEEEVGNKRKRKKKGNPEGLGGHSQDNFQLQRKLQKKGATGQLAI